MKKIAVVTVNYNTEKETKNLIESLKKVNLSDFSLDIFVVDNASERKFTIDNEKNVSVIPLKENTGFTGGYNAGMKRALENGADYVLIINSDTTVDKDIVLQLKKVLDSDENVGAVVPKIYFAKGHEFHKDKYKKDELGKVFWYAGGYIDWDNAQSKHIGVDEVDHGKYDEIKKVEFATGCCIMFKKETLEKVGFFDEGYFLYFEDADMSIRIQNAGYSIYYVPTAILHHVNAASSGGAGKGNALQDYFMTRNQMLFGMMYAPLRTKLALFKQSLRLHINGRPEQKKGIKDFYFGNFGKGTFFNK